MVDPMAPYGPGTITGLLPSGITGSNATASLNVTAGAAVDSTNARLLTLASTYNWSVTADYQGGTMLPSSTTIHFFLCNGSGGTRVWAHTSLTPTPPVGYNSWYRRTFSLFTNSSGVLVGGNTIEESGGALTFFPATPVNDLSGVTPTTGSRTLYVLSVPMGIKVRPLVRTSVPAPSSGTVYALYTSPDEPDSPTGGLTADVGTVSSTAVSIYTYLQPYLTTNTSGQIGARFSSSAATISLQTRGWIDFRRI